MNAQTQARQIFDQFHFSDAQRAQREQFYGADMSRQQFPLGYATLAEVESWMSNIDAVRREFSLTAIQMRPLDHIGYPATIEQMREFAQAKIDRVYQANDELPRSATLVQTFEHGDPRWPAYHVYLLGARYYVTIGTRVIGNRSNPHARGEAGCYFDRAYRAIDAAQAYVDLITSWEAA